MPCCGVGAGFARPVIPVVGADRCVSPRWCALPSLPCALAQPPSRCGAALRDTLPHLPNHQGTHEGMPLQRERFVRPASQTTILGSPRGCPYIRNSLTTDYPCQVRSSEKGKRQKICFCADFFCTFEVSLRDDVVILLYLHFASTSFTSTRPP